MPLAVQISPIGQIDYDDSMTLTEVRDAFLDLGLMAAYVPPPPAPPSADKFVDIGDDKFTPVDDDTFVDIEE